MNTIPKTSHPAGMILALLICGQFTFIHISSAQHSKSVRLQILTVLTKQFQKRNPNIGIVELFDVRPLLLNPINYPEKPNHYLVIARGLRGDQRFQGNWDDELMGLFLFDDSLFAVKRVLNYIPTKHWGDFIVKVVDVGIDSVTVRGVDFRDGETDFVRRYYLLK